MKKILLIFLLTPLFVLSQVSEPTVESNTIDSIKVPLVLNSNEIKLSGNKGGIYEIDVKVNNVLDIPFILDTGASESSMPLFVLNTLISTNTVFKGDRLEDRTYIMADGSTTKSRRIIIRKLKIGNNEVENIAFSISDEINSPLLLGQNVLSLFKEVRIDYSRSTITLIK